MEEFCVEYFVSIITGSLCGLDFVMFFTAVYKEADDKKTIPLVLLMLMIIGN